MEDRPRYYKLYVWQEDSSEYKVVQTGPTSGVTRFDYFSNDRKIESVVINAGDILIYTRQLVQETK